MDGGENLGLSDAAGDGRPVVVAPLLPDLPLGDLPWERYETLLRRLAQDERGLRSVRLYGVRGQSQYGVDLVGRAPDGSGEAIQAKRYEKFTEADLRTAVEYFLSQRSGIPFPVGRLFVVAACDADRRQVTDELYRLAEAHGDVEIDFWDRRTQCDMLRRRRDIVVEFFGDAVAEAFCYPAPISVVPAIPPDRVVLADALLRGPAEVTGAQVRLAHADRLQADQPDRAADAVQDAIEVLRVGGFADHAAVLVPRRAELLDRAGRRGDGVRLLSEEFWQAVALPDVDEAEALLSVMRRGEHDATTRRLVDIAERAMSVLRDPLGLPEIVLDADIDADVAVEQGRLAVLAAHSAATDPDCAWRTDNAQILADITTRLVDPEAPTGHRSLREELALALIEVADATGGWEQIVTDARRHRLSRQTAAEVLARYAMHVAERGGHEDADQAWADAIEQGCLAGDNAHAAEWVHARRILSSRHVGISTEFADAHRLVRALYAISGGPPYRQERLRERALRAMLDEKPHVAVPNLRSLLRIAHAAGCWGEIIDARELLAEAYLAGAEPERAVTLLIAAGRTAAAEKLTDRVGDTYFDVRRHLAPTRAYWVPATALRVISKQSDIVPDDHVPDIVDAAIDVLDRHQSNTLIDSPLLAPSVLLEAVKALAALATRLSDSAATAVLGHLAPGVPRAANSYRFTDDAHVQICVAIADKHEPLRGAALEQLLGLLAAADSGVSQTVEHQAADLFRRFHDLVADRLRELASEGNTAATTLLIRDGDLPDQAQLANASARLTAPLRNTATSIGVGTDAVRQSELARHLPPEDRRHLVAIQLDRAASPYEPGHNRAEYLIAAANLSHDLDDTDELFRRATVAGDDAAPSPGDLMTGLGSHPLGTFRVSGQIHDTRPHAVLVAAALARTPEQRAEVRARALGLLEAQANYYAVRALQALPSADLRDDLPLLVVQRDWPPRSLAAIIWATGSPTDDTIGLLLARDAELRVRKSLAGAAAQAVETPAIATVIAVLRNDAHSSVRSLLP